MRHDWIFDVLSDLHAYAESNELQELALKLQETLAMARWEVALADGDEIPDPPRRSRPAH